MPEKKPFAIIYDYDDQSTQVNKGNWNIVDDLPDVTRLELANNIWRVRVKFERPLEHELILNSETRYNIKENGMQNTYTAFYYPDAVILTHDQMMKRVKRNEILERVEKNAQTQIEYANNYAGRTMVEPVADNLKDQLYALTRNNNITTLSENSAILSRLPERNSNGQIWKKVSPLMYRFGLK